jgi:cytoplasmic iron level regulating protein YaaA (DUF328/UPF0246 family)
MMILVPPSETKVSGGDEGSHLDLGSLSFLVQTPLRQKLANELVALAGNPAASLRALKLGPKGLGELQRNRELWEAPVMPALSRYTGVLYDALGVDTLDGASRERALSSIAIFSALFGLIRASDRIPAYRLSFDSGGLGPLSCGRQSMSSLSIFAARGIAACLRCQRAGAYLYRS